MNRLIGLFSVYIFTALSPAQACEVAPDHYPSEYINNVSEARNILKTSTSIILGQFEKTNKMSPLTFRIRESLKSNEKELYDQTELVNFLDVKHVYFLPRKDKHGNVMNTDNLLNILKEKSIISKLIPFKKQYRPGQLSSVIHFADCERTALIFSDDEYILFLDKKGIIQARFSIDINSIELSTIRNKLTRILTENTP